MRPHTVLPLPGLALFYRTWLAHTGNTPTLSPDSKPGTRLEPGSKKPPKRVAFLLLIAAPEIRLSPPGAARFSKKITLIYALLPLIIKLKFT